MDNSSNNSALDPKLSALLDELRPIPDRNPDIMSANRARFETELDAYLNSNYAPVGMEDSTSLGMVQKIKEYTKMMTAKYRVGLTILAIILAAGLILSTGAGATVSAAQGALPGDALYSIKTGWEQTQASLNRDSYEQVMMYLKFSELRLNEIESLIAEGRYSDISTAVDEFEFYLQLVIQSLGRLAGEDAQRAAELTKQISNALSRYAALLTGMMAKVPQSSLSDLQRALLTSGNIYSLGDREEIEFTGIVESILDDTWTVDGQVVHITPWTEIDDSPVVGDLVKVHAYIAGDGTLTAREIERDIMDNGDDRNSNSNDNDDGDDRNSNLNDNDDDDDWNSNSNTNDNDDDRNSNSNINDDDDDWNSNSNDNDDDDWNSNSNDNDDDDDDNQNSNSNDNDNDDDNNDNEDDADNDNNDHDDD